MLQKRIILYIGQIEALDLFTLELAKGFSALGIEYFIYNSKKPDSAGLSSFCSKTVDAIVSFNTMFFNLLIGDNQNAWHALGIPYITILVDHPINFHTTLSLLSKNDKVFCIDREHASYVSRFFPNIGQVGFLPHGGSIASALEEIPFSERPIDILYAGGITPYHTELTLPGSLIQKYNGILDLAKIVSDLYHEAIAHYNLSLEAVIEGYMTNYLGELDAETLHMLFQDFHFLHTEVLTYHRSRILEAAAQSGAELHIYGSGYETYPFAQRENVHLHGFVSPYEVLNLMGQSKIVLSSMAWFKDGFHERIPNGMLAKAVVITEETRYVQKNFCTNPDDEDQTLYAFSLGHVEDIKTFVSEILSNPEKAQKIATNGYNLALQQHSWANRAKYLWECIK